MSTALLLIHGLLGVALLGAITHQAFATLHRVEPCRVTFFGRFCTTDAAVYSNIVVVLLCAIGLIGAVLYPEYRRIVRPLLQKMDLRTANGVFELKEHFAALGLILLPAYWASWRPPLDMEYATTRRWLTWAMAATIWWNFLAGQFLVAIKGLFS